MDRVRARVGDKRVLALVKAFLKAGILGEDRVLRENRRRNPAGVDPLAVAEQRGPLGPGRAHRPGPGRARDQHGPNGPSVARQGLPNYRLVRYADDWCLMVSGTKADAEALREEIAGVLSTMGLRLSPEKTLITHIDEGLDFLGWRIQRHRKRGTNRHYVYTYPSRKALKAVMGKVKTSCRQDGHEPAARCPAASSSTGCCGAGAPTSGPACPARPSSYLSSYTWGQVIGWLRRKHRRITWKELRRRYCGGRMVAGRERTRRCSTPPRCAPRATDTGAQLSRRPGRPRDEDNHTNPDGACGAPGARKRARRVREAARGNGPVERPAPRPGPTSPWQRAGVAEVADPGDAWPRRLRRWPGRGG